MDRAWNVSIPKCDDRRTALIAGHRPVTRVRAQGPNPLIRIIAG
jgi:hypothetical protein